MINKSGDEPMSSGDSGPYYEDFETNHLPKGEKGKTGDTHSETCLHYLKIVQKILMPQ